VIGYIDNLQIVTTSNYSAVANLRTLHITRGHAKYSQCVFASRFLVTDSNFVLCLRPTGWLMSRNWLSRQSQSESELLHGWQFTANEFVLAKIPLRLTTSNFIFKLNTCGYSPYITSLTRVWVCSLELLLVLVSAVILRSESSGTHDSIFLSQIQDSPNLEGQVPVFISPRNKKKKNLRGFSPQANYTDRAIAAGQRS
jgi:hypothetical protein